MTTTYALKMIDAMRAVNAKAQMYNAMTNPGYAVPTVRAIQALATAGMNTRDIARHAMTRTHAQTMTGVMAKEDAKARQSPVPTDTIVQVIAVMTVIVYTKSQVTIV
jgi:hypothetical protein